MPYKARAFPGGHPKAKPRKSIHDPRRGLGGLVASDLPARPNPERSDHRGAWGGPGLRQPDDSED